MGTHDPSLADLLNDVWRARKPVAVSAALFFLIALVFVFACTPLYRASMIVAPADGYALGDYASSVSEGQSLTIPFWRPREAEGISTDFHRFIYTIKGKSVAAILLKDKTVLDGIAKDGGFGGGRKNWTAEELADYLERNIRIEHLGATPLRRISYRHPDRDFAASFLRKVHLVSDQLIRRDRRRQSESRIKYLEESLQKTVNPEHRRGIANLLMQQEHVQMLANLDEAYAAIVVEPPAGTPQPVWPDRLLLLSVLPLVGAMTGYALHTVRSGKARNDR